MHLRTLPALPTLPAVTLYMLLLWIVLTSACTLVVPNGPIEEKTAPPQGEEGTIPPQSDEAIAVITNVQGDVRWTPSSLSGERVDEMGRKAMFKRVGLMAQTQQEPEQVEVLQPLKNGGTLTLHEGAVAAFVCNSGFLQGVEGPNTVQVEPATCGRGRPVPPNSTPSEEPSTEGNGGTVAKKPLREGKTEYGQKPVLISPRNTSVQATAPSAIVWVNMDGMGRYELALLGAGNPTPQTVTNEDLTCVMDESITQYDICTLPWPPEWELSPGASYILTISAQTERFAALYKSEPVNVYALQADMDEEVLSNVQMIEAIDTVDTVSTIDELTRHILLAGLYEENGLYNAALTAYAEAAKIQPAPRIYERMGFLYLNMELYRFALDSYTRAQQLLEAQSSPSPEVQAAVALGIGLVHYKWTDYADAVPYLEEASQLYAEAALVDAQMDVQNVLADALERIP